MELTGALPGLLLQVGLGVGAAVVLLYILKLRRRPIAVPFSRLWEAVLKDKESTSLFSHLKRLLSLLLQLALLALLLLALGDPRKKVQKSEGRTLVVLLDASASMKAVDVDADMARVLAGDASEDEVRRECQPGSPELERARELGVDCDCLWMTPEGARLETESPRLRSRLDAAKDEVRALVAAVGGADRMLLAQMDATVTPKSTMTNDPVELGKALAEVHAVDVRADFSEALRFAKDALRGLPKAEIVVVGDGALGAVGSDVELGDVKLSFVPIGESERNVAITAFSVRRYPLDKSRYEVMLEVANTGSRDEDVELTLCGDGLLADVKHLHLAAGESLSRFYPNLSGAREKLAGRMRLRGGFVDALPSDDRAYAVLPERKRARIQVVSPGNMYLDAALLLDEYLDVTTVAPKQYPAAGEFDVTIFDGVNPPVAPKSGHLFYLNPGADNVPFKVDKELTSDAKYTVGFDEVDEKSPLLRYLSLGDVHIARAHPLLGEKDDKAVGKSFRGALLLQGRRQGQKFVALGFDVRESDLPLRIAWPLFVLNVINDFVEEDTGYISSFTTGSVWHLPAPAAVDTATLTLPDGSERVVPVKDGRAIFLGDTAGFYALASGAGSAAESSRFAANISDPGESHVAPAAELVVKGVTAGTLERFTVGVQPEIWIYILLGVLGISAIEWLTYHRRLTV
ncbi:MAG: VWA domain-containing protein [Polyangiaceae bacterium]|nr:VWA domain-containing protein [Polyangiaceae bacterium]